MNPFFRRRVNIEKVREFLKINAEQVYYETKSYDQFKYELTLRVVEAIMWNEYELGWENLPEEEEIEFVTEVSNILEKDIKTLFNQHKKKMNLQENISTQLKRRTHLVDMVIDNLLPNMYPCDYNSSDHFVEGVLDEIRWFLVDVEELQGIERMDIENYILDYKYDELTEYFNERCVVLKNDNLQESIKRILRENDYSPAGKEVIPNKIVVHKSNPMFRDKILQDGLKVKAGECYKIYVGYGTKCKPAIFATNSTNKRAWFDSTYDDDVWEINTEMIPDVKWFKDRHYESRSKHIVTFQDIPREAITLKYEGSGSGDAETWDKNSPNLFESIRRILREESKPILMIRRRVPNDELEKEFSESLDMSSNLLRNTNKKDGSIMSLNRFINVTVSILMDGIHYELYSTMPEDSQWYDEVMESLKDYYKDRIKSRYKKLVSNI